MTSSSSGQNEHGETAQADRVDARSASSAYAGGSRNAFSDDPHRHDDSSRAAVRARAQQHKQPKEDGDGCASPPRRRPTKVGDGLCAAPSAPSRDDVDLEKTIETQVIPRLLLAHRDEADACMSTSWMRGMDTSRAAAMDPVTSVFAAASAQMLAARAPAPAAGRARSGAYAAATAAHRRGRYRGRDVSQQCAAIAHLAVRDSADALVALLDSDLCAGLTPERIFLERLAPAARLLGEMWSNDIYSFTDVTVGLCRLRQAFEELRARLPDPGIHPDQFSVLVSPAPGDQHSFGAAMIAHLFTQASWSVFNEIRGDEDVLLRSLKARRFDLLGLSLNTDHALERLPGFVLKAKRESKNQDLVIMIGGSLIGARPEIARELGVLAALSDPYGAIEQAEHLVRRAARRM